MPITSWESPSSVIGASWSPGGSLVAAVANSDNTYATHASGIDDLISTGFGFSLPVGAIVDGVEVYLEAGRQFQIDATTIHSRLTLDGTTKVGDDRIGHLEHTLDNEDYFGSPTYKYGLALTRSDVNASTFGIIFWFENIDSPSQIRVDQIRMRIHYSDTGVANLPIDLASKLKRIPAGVRPKGQTNRKEEGLMPVSDATVFPIRGQAFQFVDVIKSSATGNPLTGGLEDLTLMISKDGGDLAVAGPPVELADDSGWITIDLDEEDMDAGVIAYQVLASNENAVYATGEIKTCDFSEAAGRADGAEVEKLEQYLLQMWSQLFNRHTVNRDTGAYTVYQSDDATASVSGLATDDGTLGSRGKLG